MRRLKGWSLLGPVLIYRRRGLMTPPITGDPYSLSLPGQSRGETVAMWAQDLLAVWAMVFVSLMCVGLLAYPLAMTVLWLMLLFQ